MYCISVSICVCVCVHFYLVACMTDYLGIRMVVNPLLFLIISQVNNIIAITAVGTSLPGAPRLLLLSSDGGVVILDVEGVADAAVGIWTVMAHIRVNITMMMVVVVMVVIVMMMMVVIVMMVVVVMMMLIMTVIRMMIMIIVMMIMTNDSITIVFFFFLYHDKNCSFENSTEKSWMEFSKMRPILKLF